jgi:PAS domain S-box-containing protein
MGDPEKISSLRQQAEELALEKEAQSPDNLDAVSIEETRQALHELRVHQVELEMQNEELRRAQVELDAERARFFELFDLAPVGYCTVSDNGLIFEANLTLAMLLGVARGAIGKHPINRFILAEDQVICYHFLKILFKTGELQVSEFRMIRVHAAPFWARLDASAPKKNSDGISLSRIAISDITKRKQAEEALLASEERFRLAIEATTDGLWDWNITTGFVDYSPAWKGILGIEDLESNYEFWDSRIHPDDRPEVIEALQGHLAGKTAQWSKEHRLLTGQGTWKWVLGRGRVIVRDVQGRPCRMIGTMTDISQRKNIAQSMRESEERFSLALEVGNAGVWEWNQKSDEVRFDARFHSMLGYEPGDLPSSLQEWLPYHHPEDLTIMMSKARAYLDGAIPLYESEHRIRTKAGTWNWVFTRGKLVNLTAPECSVKFIGIAMNVTERRLAEDALENQLSELERVNKLMIGRETKMIELKKEINELCHQLNLPKRYSAPENISQESKQ